MPKQIFWTQELTIVLLEVIHMKGAHTPGYGKTEEVWDSVREKMNGLEAFSFSIAVSWWPAVLVISDE